MKTKHAGPWSVLFGHFYHKTLHFSNLRFFKKTIKFPNIVAVYKHWSLTALSSLFSAKFYRRFPKSL